MQSFLIVALHCMQQEPLELWCERRQRRRRKRRGSRGRRSRKRQRRRRRRQWRRRRRHVREVIDGGSRLSPSDPGDPHGEGPWLRSPGQSASAGHTSVRHPRGADYSGEEKLKNCQFSFSLVHCQTSFSANSLTPIHQLSAPSPSPPGPGRPPGEVQERHHSGTPEDQLGREPGCQQPAEPGRWRRRRRRRHGQRVLPTWRFVQRKRKIIIGRSSKKLLLLKVAPTILTRFCKWKKALCPKLS